MYNHTYDIIKLYRSFDLNSVIPINYNSGFLKSNYLLISNQIQQEGYMCLVNNLLSQNQKILVETYKAKISNYTIGASNLYQSFDYKFIEDDSFLNVYYNLYVKAIDLNISSTYSSLALLNRQETGSLLIDKIEIIPTIIIDGDEVIRKDSPENYTPPSIDIFLDDVEEGAIYECQNNPLKNNIRVYRAKELEGVLYEYQVVSYRKSNDISNFNKCFIYNQNDLNHVTTFIPYQYKIRENFICFPISKFSLAEILGLKLKEYLMCKPEDKSDDENRKSPDYFTNFSNTDFRNGHNDYRDSGGDYPDSPGGGGWWPWFSITKPINKSENLEFNPIKKHIYTMFLANLGLYTVRLPFFQNFINDLSERIYSLEEAKTLLSIMSINTLLEYFFDINAFINYNVPEEENKFITPRKNINRDDPKTPGAPKKKDYEDDVSTNVNSYRSDIPNFEFIGIKEREYEFQDLKDDIELDGFNPNKSSFIEYGKNTEEIDIDSQNNDLQELQKKKEELEDRIKKLKELKEIFTKKNKTSKSLNIDDVSNQNTFRNNLEEQIRMHESKIKDITIQEKEKVGLLGKMDGLLLKLDEVEKELIKRIFKLLKSGNNYKLKLENYKHKIELQKNSEEYNRLKKYLEYEKSNEVNISEERITEKKNNLTALKNKMLDTERVIEENNKISNVTDNVDGLLRQYQDIIEEKENKLKEKKKLEDELKEIDDEVRKLNKEIAEAENILSEEVKKSVESEHSNDFNFSDTKNLIEQKINSLAKQIKLLTEEIDKIKNAEEINDLMSTNGEQNFEKIDGHTSDNVTVVSSSEKSPSLKLDLSSIKNDSNSELGGDNSAIDLNTEYYKDM